MRGSIRRRGPRSWEIKFDTGKDATGRRLTRYVSIKGKRQDAEKELTRLLKALHEGTLADPSSITVSECLNSWLDGPNGLGKKTLERYKQLASQQIGPFIGAIPIQQLRPATIQAWHVDLIKGGGKGGKALAPQTVRSAHAVLHTALERAMKAETISRNPASAVSPPRVKDKEIEALTGGEMKLVLDRLQGHWLFPIVAFALATGCRRGETLSARWADLDLDKAMVIISRSLEETASGLAFKPPKTKHSRRSISLPANIIETLKAHRITQLEHRMALGLGKQGKDALIFSLPDGQPLSPDAVSRAWSRAVKTFRLPAITFHALRHSHASALIASGLDVLTVSRRLGHGSPTITLSRYGHMFRNTDDDAARAIDAAMKMER